MHVSGRSGIWTERCLVTEVPDQKSLKGIWTVKFWLRRLCLQEENDLEGFGQRYVDSQVMTGPPETFVLVQYRGRLSCLPSFCHGGI